MAKSELKLVVISDTHRMHDRLGSLPNGDVLIHCGDSCSSGSLAELSAFANWLDKQNFEHKLVIAGNHDGCLQNTPIIAEDILVNHCTYLLDSGVEIDGFRFYGSPWQPKFFDWAFNLPRGGDDLRACWKAIPDNTDVLITHCPPKGILDRASDGYECGCEHLASRVLEVKPRYHLFGHIHEGYGTLAQDETTYVNAAICTYNYVPSNKPICVTLAR